MKKITVLLAAMALGALIDARPGHAYYEGPWCAYMSTGFDSYDRRCDLPNYQACQAEIAATPGTWCTQNPRYLGPVAKPKVRRKRS
jgi:hypothetical protein